MTQMTDQQVETPFQRVATKLQNFSDGLTDDEHRALDAALQYLARPDQAADDVHGHRDIIQWKPTIVECVVWQEQVRSLVEVLTLGLVSNFTPDCSNMPIPSQPA